jgi:hypothetical protein|tara:strand:- start:2289 stop:2555 length:267 start_codon:yes stop_codon:yes gene_type:complete
MTVKTKHGDFECRDLTFKDRRELHRLEVSAVSADGTVDSGKFYNVLEWVMNFAFENAEASLKNLDDNEIDIVLMDIYNQYKVPNKKKN